MNIKKLRVLMALLLAMQAAVLLASCSAQARQLAIEVGIIALEHELRERSE